MSREAFGSNFFIRTASALVMLALFLFVMIKGGMAFSIAVLFIASASIFEWHNITSSASHASRALWDVVGLVIILFSCIAMLYIGYENDRRPMILLCGSVWCTDIFAYVIGKYIGGAKLAPTISPGKTISGCLGGIIGAAVFGLVFGIVFGGSFYALGRTDMITCAVIISILAQISDLLESAFKRKFGVKDSGFIIPGHGGILDRIDSFMLPLPFVMIYLMAH